MSFTVVSKKSGKTYYLHGKDVELKGAKGRKQRIHWFSGKDKLNPENALDAMPEGYKVIENPKTGLPMLKKA
ncbi:MAG: hypothetical protein WC045_03350 [Patescibacteria group bacterium]